MNVEKKRFTSDSTKEKRSAHQKFSTVNPGTIADVRSTSSALITPKKSPKVKMVIGNVRMVRIGFKKTFTAANTITTITALTKPDNETPGRR